MTDKNETSNPIKAIRAKCLDCCCGNPNEVQLCPAIDCALHPFRMGKNPFRQKVVMSEERKAKCAELLRKAREAKQMRTA